MTEQDFFQDKHILLVEDEFDNLEVARHVLEMRGATVYCARNGKEGLALLAGITPDFVVLDLSMPVMDGWEMLRQMRADPRFESLPAIALTAHAMEEDRERVIEAGFDGYITKPFSPDELVEHVYGWLTDELVLESVEADDAAPPSDVDVGTAPLPGLAGGDADERPDDSEGTAPLTGLRR